MEVRNAADSLRITQGSGECGLEEDEPRNCQSGGHRAQRKGEHQNLNTKISRPSVCLLHTVEPLQPGAAELRCPNDTSNR